MKHTRTPACVAEVARRGSIRRAGDLHVLYSCRQPLCALMRAAHPLAREAGPVRLRDCLAHPLALPDRSLAIRRHLERALARRGVPLGPAVESGSLEFLRNLVLREGIVSLQVPSGIPDDPWLASRPIDPRDLDPMVMILGQLRGRMLPVAAAKVADQLRRPAPAPPGRRGRPTRFERGGGSETAPIRILLKRCARHGMGGMTTDRRLIHASSNGDRWWLCRGDDPADVAILHEPNAPSGGRASRVSVGAFLRAGAGGPEHQALLHLIGSLIADASPPSPPPAPEPGAAAAEPTPGEALA